MKLFILAISATLIASSVQAGCHKSATLKRLEAQQVEVMVQLINRHDCTLVPKVMAATAAVNKRMDYEAPLYGCTTTSADMSMKQVRAKALTYCK